LLHCWIFEILCFGDFMHLWDFWGIFGDFVDCWIVGLLDCWTVGLWDCWNVGLLDVLHFMGLLGSFGLFWIL